MRTIETWRTQARPADDYRYTDAALTLERIELSVERASSSESKLRLAGTGARHNNDGAYIIERVQATLHAQDGSLVRVQRTHDDDSPLAVGKHVAWSHQVYDGELAAAHSVRYVIETRIRTTRTMMTCELGTPDLFAETTTWPITAKTHTPNDLVSIDVALALRKGKRVDISLLAESAVTSRDLNIAAEYYFLDKDGVAVATGGSSYTSTVSNGFTSERTSAGIERVGSSITALAVRIRVEASLISELAPLVLPASCRSPR